MKVNKVMSIAASDSGGGAGVQADLKTFAANNCYGTSVFVALTAQNTLEVAGIYPIDTDFIRLQFETVMADIGTDAIKIGMLHREAVIKTLAPLLQAYPETPIVLDPVMVSQSGFLLLEESAITSMCADLFPLATLLTPNLKEAEWLMQCDEISRQSMPDIAKQMAQKWCANVLLKGGHLAGNEFGDYLFEIETGKGTWFNHPRIDTKNCHGTGCTLSSAIASNLAKQQPLNLAVKNAVAYLQKALEAGVNQDVGVGEGPVAHFGLYN